MTSTITRDTAIEELVDTCPKAIGLLIEAGLPCVVCGEPFWGTIGDLAESKGLSESAIEHLVLKVQKCCPAD